MTVDPGYKHVEKFSGGITMYMMQSKDIFSSICFELKNENIQLVSFNGQSITFLSRLKSRLTFVYQRNLKDRYLQL